MNQQNIKSYHPKQKCTHLAQFLFLQIVNIETLKKSSQNLIATLQEVRTVREQGKQNRAKATHELALLQSQLNQQLLLEGGHA